MDDVDDGPLDFYSVLTALTGTTRKLSHDQVGNSQRSQAKLQGTPDLLVRSAAPLRSSSKSKH